MEEIVSSCALSATARPAAIKRVRKMRFKRGLLMSRIGERCCGCETQQFTPRLRPAKTKRERSVTPTAAMSRLGSGNVSQSFGDRVQQFLRFAFAHERGDVRGCVLR